MRRVSIRHRTRAQGLVEAALVVLATIPLVVGLLAVARMLENQAAVNVVAYEAARSAAQANTSAEAEALAQARTSDLAAAYGLTNGTLVVVLESADVERGQPVVARARYQVGFADIPLLGWAQHQVSSRHTELVERHRSILTP